jgi:penicillin amidase
LEIIRDGNGVLHIYAEHEPDVFLAVGFAQAADRLYLVDVIRHLGAGRLCELIGNLPAPRGNELVKGKRVADLDIFARPFDFEGQSERDFARLDARAAACLEAYAGGFNAALRAMRGVYPPEYLALGAVRAWKPADCLLAARTCAFVIAVTALENELTFDAVRGACGDDVARRIYPDAPWENVPATYRAADAGAPEPPFHMPSGGSNNWAVGASRSESGAPIVANDPHVPLMPLPTFWHHFHLECPRYRVQGGILPGCPIFGFGHNGDLAWGVTHAFRDTFDLYRIHRLPDNPQKYRTVGGVGEIVKHREDHATRSAPIPLEWETCEHGVIYPGWKHHDGTDLALRVVPFDLARYFEGYLALAESETPDEHRAALERIHEGPFDFNHVYAHRDGHFGWQVFGRVPRRRGDGLFVRDADDPAGEWDGFLRFDEMPRMLNPPRGSVATANTMIDPEMQARLFTLVHCEPFYRQRQIDGFLDALPRHSTATFAELQSRTQSDYGVPLRDALLGCLEGSFPGDGLAARAVSILSEWEGAFGVDSCAATLFFHVQRELAHRIGKALLGKQLGTRYANGRRALPRLHRMLLDEAEPLRVDVERATGLPLARLVRESFVAALKHLAHHFGGVPEDWRWGMVHRARFGTLFSLLPVVGKRFLALDEGFPGDDYTVSPSRPIDHRGYLYAFVGATSRFICDLAKPEEAWFAHSSGPSADVSSVFFANLSVPWRRFEHFRSCLWKAAEVPNRVEHAVIEPRARASA